MQRREFLVGAAAVASMFTSRQGWAQVAQRQAKLDRIAVMAWAFDKVVHKVDDPNNPLRNVPVMQIAQVFADRFGVHNVEMQHSYFESLEPAYMQQFKDSIARARSKLTQINLELGQLNIAARGNSQRLQTLDLTRLWVDRCAMLGCPRLMINQGGLVPEVLPTATATLRAMAQYGTSKGVMVTMENRDANWRAMGDIARASGARITPDLGAFPNKEEQLAAIPVLLPIHSGNAHAKTDLPDLAGAIRRMRELGYDGLYAIEVEPPPPDPYPAVQAVIDTVLANI